MKYIKFLIVGLVLFLSGCESEEPIDNEPPVVQLSADIQCKANHCEAPLTYVWAFGEDEEDGEIPCAFDFSEVEFDTPGIYTATCTVTDSDGDSATADFDVTILGNEIPVPRLVAPTPIDVGIGQEVAEFDWAVGEDEEDGELACVYDFSEVQFTVVGSYTATCTVTDVDGDTDSIDIPINILDNTPPVVQKMNSHVDTFEVGDTIDLYSNILIYDNYYSDLDIDVDDSELLYDTPGTYDVHYIVTDGSDNATVLDVSYTLTEVIIPTFTETISFDEDSILIDYEVFDPSNTFIRLDVVVEKEGEPFMVDSFFDIEYEIDIPVPSNTPFRVTLTYLYDIKDGHGPIVREINDEILSDSWEIPEYDFTIPVIQTEEATISLDLTDNDGRLIDSYFNLYDGELGIYDETTLVRTFPVGELVDGLLTNHDYRLELVYLYNMDDEEGIVEVRTYEDFTTQTVVTPYLVVSNDMHLSDRIVFDFLFANFEYIISPITVNIYEDHLLMNPIYTIDLDPNVEQHIDIPGPIDEYYYVSFEFEYDLRDGNGSHYEFVTYQSYTTAIEILSIVQVEPIVMEGNPIYIEIEIYSPSEYYPELIQFFELGFTCVLTSIGGNMYSFTIQPEYAVPGIMVLDDYVIYSNIYAELGIETMPTLTINIIPVP